LVLGSENHLFVLLQIGIQGLLAPLSASRLS